MITKTLFKAILVAIILFGAVQVKAQQASVPAVSEEVKDSAIEAPVPAGSHFQAAITQIEAVADKFKLWVTNTDAKWFTVTISCDNGYEWTYTYNVPSISQVFDLSTLEDGEYYVKVRCGKQCYRKKVTLGTTTYTKRQIAFE